MALKMQRLRFFLYINACILYYVIQTSTIAAMSIIIGDSKATIMISKALSQPEFNIFVTHKYTNH